MLTKMIPIKFDPVQYNKLKQTAADLGIPMAEIVRKATETELLKLSKGVVLSDLASLAQDFPENQQHLTDDELLYGKDS